jgi:DNA-binding GntR family transcriptional regulator
MLVGDHLKTKPLPRKTDVAYERLRELIVTLQIEPGTPIDEGALMYQLGIGRTPLREAVQRLSHEGFVVHVPRRGSWASSLSILDLRQMVEARRLVEPAAARMAAERINSEQIRNIHCEIDRAELLASEGNFADCVFLDQSFHSMIALAAGNSSLSRMIERVNQELMRYWYFSFVHIRNLGPTFCQHREILELVANGDGIGAEQLMHEHIDLFLSRVQAALDAGQPRSS